MYGNSPLPDLPTCYFWVIDPIAFPVRAAAGEYLAVFAQHENIWVIDATERCVVRRGSFPESKLWTTLDDLVEQGLIRHLLFDGVSTRRPASPAPSQSRPVLRLIRAG